MAWIRNFLRDEEGVTAVEYAVMLALIILVCVGSVGVVGMNTRELMDPGGRLTTALGSGS
ncbi:Flp family type IVb pilin [bacterium]|jgi:pilus assembly protein Flp/PilA|nr:Flp family type IVb pilin [bacterium]